MAISAVQNESAASVFASLNGTTAASSADSAAELSDRFLQLLVTQLKNQDPMNPMDNAEMTSQLAQISTVEGVNNLNTTVDGLVAQFKSNQVMQGASLVNRQVLAEGDALTLSAAGAAGGVGLAASADGVKIKVMDGNGAVVQTLELGAQDAGLVRFVWDGVGADGQAQPEGLYTFKVEASAADQSVAASTYALGNVLSVSLDGSDMSVEVSGLGARGLDQIRQIF